MFHGVAIMNELVRKAQMTLQSSVVALFCSTRLTEGKSITEQIRIQNSVAMFRCREPGMHIVQYNNCIDCKRILL